MPGTHWHSPARIRRFSCSRYAGGTDGSSFGKPPVGSSSQPVGSAVRRRSVLARPRLIFALFANSQADSHAVSRGSVGPAVGTKTHGTPLNSDCWSRRFGSL